MNEKVPGVLPVDVKGAKSGRTSGGYTYGQRERALRAEGTTLPEARCEV